MKIFILFTALFISNSVITVAQENEKRLPLTLSYYGGFFIQPGAQLGTRFDLEKKTRSSKVTNLFVRPQVAFFTRPNRTDNLILATEFGYRSLRMKKNYYSEYAFALGYLSSWETLSLSVNLGTGNISNRDVEQRSYFLPTVSYTFGRDPGTKLGWFSKVSFGREISSAREDAGFFALEVGILYNLKLK